MAAVDYFLKIEGIDGESRDDKHKGEIDIESFSWGATQLRTTTFAQGGALASGKVDLQDFHFTMPINKSSPKLFLACASGQHIKQATFIGETSDFEGGSQQFLKYTFTDILVSSYAEAGAANGVADASALNFANVKTEATPGTTIHVAPEGTGNLMFDPKTGQVVVTESASGLLASGPSLGREGGSGFTRGVVEYALTDLVGIINGPNPCALMLDVREVRPAGEIIGVPSDQLVIVGDVAAAPGDTLNAFPGKGPVKKLFRHDVYWYGPADLALTAEDFSRRARLLGSIQVDPSDPSGTPAEMAFDLCEIVRQNGLASIGIRIQSAMDHTALMQEEGDVEPPDPEFLADGTPFTISPAMFLLDLSLELN